MAMTSEVRIKRMLMKQSTMQMEIASVPVDPKRLRNQKEYMNRCVDQIMQAGGDTVEKIDILVDSCGGSVHSVLGLIHALNSGKIGRVEKRVLITGMCASAATLLTGIGCPLYITPTGRMHIHTARRADGGAATRLGASSTTRLMISCYRGRSKKNGVKTNWKRYFREMDELGVYLSAAEAEAVGLVDGILTRSEFEKG